MWKSEEDIKKHYRTDYRKPPTANNAYTGQRKVQFHASFLGDTIKKWREEKRQNIEIFEVGAAYGMALDYLRKVLPGANVSGTELTTSYRRNAYHEFGIELAEDFDKSKKYDLIMSYKVAEHQLDVDKRLREYVECLKDDGLMYISVPIWFGPLGNFGANGFDIEYYYDPNHINVWTRKLFETLLKKVGLEIIKEDHVMYDSTYLCKRNDALMGLGEYENIYDIRVKLAKVYSAYLAFIENRYDDAISIYPDFPTAHVNRAEMIRKQAFEKGWPWIKENIINKAISDCPESVEVICMAADLAMRAGEWQEAIYYCEDSLRKRPNNAYSLNLLMNIMREFAIRSKDEKEKIRYFTEAREISRHLFNISDQHKREALDLIYLFNSHLPIPSEMKGAS